jgi:DNA-binding transcriptional regulator YhcF (GntR family)
MTHRSSTLIKLNRGVSSAQYRKLTIREFAKLCGTSLPTMYRVWKSLEESGSLNLGKRILSADTFVGGLQVFLIVHNHEVK